jgi:glycosyltransferase involved in cell wall biosynthesis
MKPRVAIVTTYFPVEGEPYRGPTAYQTLRRLTTRFQIEVFCPVRVYPPGLHPRRAAYRRCSRDFSPPDVSARYVEVPAIPLVTRPVNGLMCAHRLLPHIRRFRPDLILNYFLYPEGYAAVVVGAELRVPVVLGAIGSDVRCIPDAITRRLTVRTLQQASFVMTVSRELQRQVIALGATPDRTRAVLNGVDRTIFRTRDRAAARLELGVPAESRLILFVGTISAAKGVHELIGAAIRLRNWHEGLRLVCIGDGILRAPLERLIRAENLGSTIVFGGPQPSDRVSRWLAASDLLCLPSYSEGCPNAVLEALACGRPVVATDVGGISEVLTSDAGVLVPPRDVDALAAALHSALRTDWNAETIAATFQRGWDDVAEDVYDICMNTLSGN